MVELQPSTCRDCIWLVVPGPASAGTYGPWTGKWLLYVPAAEVDQRWAQIASRSTWDPPRAAAPASSCRPGRPVISRRV